MRKISIVTVAFALLVFALWFIFKDYSVKAPETNSIYTIDQLEDLVYREPFNADYQLEMARAQYGKWNDSMKTDPEAPSRSLTAYMIAYIESGEDKEIYKEFEVFYRDMLQYGSMPDLPLDLMYEKFIDLYTDFSKPHMEMIIEIKSLFESVWQLINSDLEESQEIAYARLAVVNYMRRAFDLSTGKVRLYNADTKEQIILGNGFYNKWALGMRSYGQVLQQDKYDKYSGIKNSIDSPLDWHNLTQIKTGEYTGRYILPNGDEFVAGLKYFEDIADNKYSPVTPQLTSPSDVYNHYRLLQTQKRWSEMYDLIDEKSQDQMTTETKIMLLMAAPDEESRSKLESVLKTMNGRDLHALISENSTQLPVEILSEDIDGNIAHLKIVTVKGREDISSDIKLIRSGDSWKILWGSNPLQSR